MRIAVAKAQHQGRVKEQQEDWVEVREDLGVLFVADGMGGHEAGETASEWAANVIVKFIDDARKKPAEGVRPRTRARQPPQLDQLRSAVEFANSVLYEYARRQQSLEGMGTTVVVCHLDQDHAHVASVGDSRAYLVRNGTIKQITKDHSLRSQNRKNVLTRAVGRKPDVEVDAIRLRLEQGDVLVLCSDGLSNMVSDGTILEFVEGATNLETACQGLVNEANSAGGRDNISIAMARILEVSERPALPESPSGPTRGETTTSQVIRKPLLPRVALAPAGVSVRRRQALWSGIVALAVLALWLGYRLLAPTTGTLVLTLQPGGHNAPSTATSTIRLQRQGEQGNRSYVMSPAPSPAPTVAPAEAPGATPSMEPEPAAHEGDNAVPPREALPASCGDSGCTTRITGLAPGFWTVSVEAPPYQLAVIENVMLTSGSEVAQTIRLEMPLGPEETDASTTANERARAGDFAEAARVLDPYRDRTTLVVRQRLFEDLARRKTAVLGTADPCARFRLLGDLGRQLEPQRLSGGWLGVERDGALDRARERLRKFLLQGQAAVDASSPVDARSRFLEAQRCLADLGTDGTDEMRGDLERLRTAVVQLGTLPPPTPITASSTPTATPIAPASPPEPAATPEARASVPPAAQLATLTVMVNKPSVKVTLSRSENGYFERRDVSNFTVFAGLAPGEYHLEVEKPGFVGVSEDIPISRSDAERDVRLQKPTPPTPPVTTRVPLAWTPPVAPPLPTSTPAPTPAATTTPPDSKPEPGESGTDGKPALPPVSPTSPVDDTLVVVALRNGKDVQGLFLVSPTSNKAFKGERKPSNHDRWSFWLLRGIATGETCELRATTRTSKHRRKERLELPRPNAGTAQIVRSKCKGCKELDILVVDGSNRTPGYTAVRIPRDRKPKEFGLVKRVPPGAQPEATFVLGRVDEDQGVLLILEDFSNWEEY